MRTSFRLPVFARLITVVAAGCAIANAADELTLYELLAPDTHSFAITYDVSTGIEGAHYLFNPIRRGSIASNEHVVDAATGQPLEFHVVTAARAAADGLEGKPAADQYIEVKLAHPVPKNGEARVRIFKTYKDPASYGGGSNELWFQRSFGIKRNVIVLPLHYELIGCSAPGIVSTGSDGRIRVSFFNDRDDELLVKLKGRFVR